MAADGYEWRKIRGLVLVDEAGVLQNWEPWRPYWSAEHVYSGEGADGQPTHGEVVWSVTNALPEGWRNEEREFWCNEFGGCRGLEDTPEGLTPEERGAEPVPDDRVWPEHPQPPEGAIVAEHREATAV
jgi:hypothetical protein